MKEAKTFNEKIITAEHIPFSLRYYYSVSLMQTNNSIALFFAVTLIMLAMGWGSWQPEWRSEGYAVLSIIFVIKLIFYASFYLRFKNRIKKTYFSGGS